MKPNESRGALAIAILLDGSTKFIRTKSRANHLHDKKNDRRYRRVPCEQLDALIYRETRIPFILTDGSGKTPVTP